MDKATAHKRSKKDWAALIITACLILLVIGILFEPVSSKLNGSSAPQDQQYSAKLERVSNNYKACIEEADSNIPPSSSSTYDPAYSSKTSRAADDREDCTRTYNTQMRVLKNSQ